MDGDGVFNYDRFGQMMRGNYGTGAQLSATAAKLRADRKAYRKAVREDKRYGRAIPMADGSIGYGRYRRVSRRAPKRRRLMRKNGRRVRGDPISNWVRKVVDGGVKFGKTVLGMGAYTSAISAGHVEDQDVPTISNPGGSDGPVVVRHKEFICDIRAPGAGVSSNSPSPFAVIQKLQINPGNPLCFPWLSTIAESFTQYRFQGLQFHYKSTSGSLSTTQSLGEIILSAEYNVLSEVPTNKQNMLNQIFSTSKVPAFDAHCSIECDPTQTAGVGLLYINSQSGDPTAVNADLRWQNLANFYVATQGTQITTAGADVTLGELWVTYQCALYKPQLPVDFNAGMSAHYYGTAVAVPSGASTIGGWGTGAISNPDGDYSRPATKWDQFGLKFSGGTATAPNSVLTFPLLPAGEP